MKKAIFAAILALAVICTAVTSHAATSPAITSGIGWLEATQDAATGSWGNTPSALATEFQSTAEAIATLRQMGLGNSASTQAASGWLAGQSTDNTAYASERIAALFGIYSNLTPDIANITDAKISDSGWGGQAGYDASPMHSALAMQALSLASTIGSSDESYAL